MKLLCMRSQQSCVMIVVIKKRCKVCKILKTDFYKYKNGKLYSTCIECFNKKVKCEFCNKEFNKTYLSKHIEKLHSYDNKIINNYNTEGALREENIINNNNENNTEGASRIINNNDENIIKNNDDENNNDENNRTLIVGPSFCGKTHLLLNKLQIIRLDNPE